MDTYKYFTCEKCSRKYKHRQSLFKHKCPSVSQKSPNSHPEVAKSHHSAGDDENENYKCDYCSKEFKYKQGKYRHQNKCKENTKTNEIKTLKEELKEEMKKEYEKNIDELKKVIVDLLNKNCKMHYKTLQKINNSGTMNNGVINNNTINIVALGKENIDDVLTKTDKIAILNKKENALPYMIELVHFNDKFPQFKNIAITNNRTNYAHLYDQESKVFKLVDKDELIEELIDYRVCDIEDYYMQYKNELELPVKNKIEELIEHRGDNENTKDRIKLLLFNNRHKIEIL